MDGDVSHVAMLYKGHTSVLGPRVVCKAKKLLLIRTQAAALCMPILSRTSSRDAPRSRFRGSKSPSGGRLPGRPKAKGAAVAIFDRSGPRSGGGRWTGQKPEAAGCMRSAAESIWIIEQTDKYVRSGAIQPR